MYRFSFISLIAFFVTLSAFLACSSGEQSDQNTWTQQNTQQQELSTDQENDQASESFESMEIPNLPFELENFIPSASHDSLLTGLIIRIYRRPAGSSVVTRFESRFRNWYVEQLPRFEWMAHQYNNDNHFFLIKRPARNIHGHIRTVGGIFRLNEKNEISYFQEVFNTPMLPENEARVKGALIFNNWMETGSIEKYYLNEHFIEFPDERTYYNTSSLEWSYDFSKKDTTVNDFLKSE